MNQDTPERLREFRAQNRRNPFTFVSVFLASFFFLLLGLAAGYAGGRLTAPSLHAQPNAGGLGPERLRDYAVYLEQKQLPEKAIEAYTEYLSSANLDDAARAAVCYSVGKLAAETERYEDALAFLYQAEMLAPDSEIRPDIDKMVLSCLEKLGRKTDLRRELRRRAAADRTAADIEPDELILAELPECVITNRDLERELEKMPPALRGRVSRPEERAQLLKSMAAERLMLDKAFRLGLDKDPEVEQMLAAERDALMVRKLLRTEIESRINISPGDVERYYKGEISRFTEPEKAEVCVARSPSAEPMPAEQDFSSDSMTIVRGAPIPGVDNTDEAAEAVFATDVGAVAGPVASGSEYCWFRVVAKTPARQRPLEEVRDLAERMLRAEREQEEFRSLVEDALKSADVRFYLDRLTEPAS